MTAEQITKAIEALNQVASTNYQTFGPNELTAAANTKILALIQLLN